MSGKNASSRLKKFEEDIEHYSGICGLVSPDPQALRVSEYLGLTPDQLSLLSKEDLSKIGVDCASFACRIQTAINVTSLKIRKCREKITKMTEPVLSEYSHIYKIEDRRLAALFDNSAATAYWEIQQNCEAFRDRWDSYIARLDNYTKHIQHLVYSKGS